MKKLLIIIFSLILAIIIATTSVYFLFRGEVKKHLIPETQKIIKDTTDLNVSFSDFEFSFANLLKLEPSIIIKDLKVENALSAKEAKASLYLSELVKKKFKIKNFEISNAVVNLEQKSNGEFELIGLNKKTQNKSNDVKQKQAKASQSLLEEFELKNFEISDSLISVKLYNVAEAIKLNDFNLKLSDFKLDKEQRLTTKLDLSTNLFNSKASSININGSLGPISKDFKTLPISLNEKIKISIASVPPSLLEKNMGELVQISDAYIIESAKLEGDFLGTSTGSGNLKIDNLEVGNSKQTSLNLNSEFPINFKLKNKFSPTLTLSTDGSTMNLKSKDNESGKLEFNADLAMNLKSGFINGSSSGNITGIDVKNLVSALTDLGDIVTGEIYLENYNVSFSGSTPERLFKTAKGSAQLEMKNGTIYILDTITKYKNIADEILKGLGSTIKTEKISGEFKTFKSDINLENKILAFENIDIETSEEQVKVNGRGEVRNLQWLVFDLFLDVPKLEPVPLSVRGSIEAPKIYPNVKKVTKQQSQQMLNSFIEYGLNSLKKAEPATDATGTDPSASAAPAKQQSLGGFLKDTLKDNLKDGLLEQKEPEVQVAE